MKHLFAIFLLLCISYQFVAKVGVVAWYQVNKDYIAEELCENKDLPEMRCEGKCYLQKQLDKVDDNTQDKDIPVKKQKTELPEYLTTADTYIIPRAYSSQKQVNNIYNNLYRYTLIRSVFHPPSIC